MSYFNASEAASLDRHITGNYGEDQFADAFCQDCTFYDTGHCTNENSVFYAKPMEAEDTCDEYDNIECDPRDDEPADFDERRDER